MLTTFTTTRTNSHRSLEDERHLVEDFYDWSAFVAPPPPPHPHPPTVVRDVNSSCGDQSRCSVPDCKYVYFCCQLYILRWRSLCIHSVLEPVPRCQSRNYNFSLILDGLQPRGWLQSGDRAPTIPLLDRSSTGKSVLLQGLGWPGWSGGISG